jgi:hypothetical protein
MERVNKLFFRYYVYPPDAPPRLHTSEVTETVAHTTHADMMLQIEGVIRRRLAIPGTLTVKLCPGGQRIDASNYSHIPPKAKLTVTIDAAHETTPVEPFRPP